MKITPVASPHAIQQTQTTNVQATRDKVVAKLNAKIAAATQAPVNPAQSQETAVLNPNAVSVEELGAIQTPQSQAQATDNTQETSDNSSTTEATTEVPVKTPDPEFVKLAKQEKAMRALAIKQQEQIKQKDQELQAQKQASEQAIRDAEAKSTGYITKDQLKANAMQVLADAGVSYDDLTQQILNQQTENPRVTAEINALKAEIRKLTETTEKYSQTAAEEKQANYQAAVKQIQRDVDKLVTTDPAYETIKNTNSSKAVTKLIEATFREEGRVMDAEEAAELVENHLINKYEKIFTSTSKIKQRLAKASVQSQAKTQQTQATAPQQQSQPMKTLTNATSSTRKLSNKERAVLAFKGQLKS